MESKSRKNSNIRVKKQKSRADDKDLTPIESRNETPDQQRRPKK